MRLAGPMIGLGFSSIATRRPSGSEPPPMKTSGSERLHPRHRLTAASDFSALREEGTAFRGVHCRLVWLERPGEPTRVGFVASRRGVGGAVQRNRARRRLREIVRRRWARLPSTGNLLMFIAYRSTPTVAHQILASDVERVLTDAGVLAPIPPIDAPARPPVRPVPRHIP